MITGREREEGGTAACRMVSIKIHISSQHKQQQQTYFVYVCVFRLTIVMIINIVALQPYEHKANEIHISRKSISGVVLECLLLLLAAIIYECLVLKLFITFSSLVSWSTDAVNKF